ncbi:uncharacterized protein OCT59_007157 [Rhizophagus irregularis]|nr:hypothetical protein OCT59_007157 [Rhizophagus irregularis]GBC32839.2 kinase-like domain-containing protein [Rhizophagus irregularis DAOM 181602=DAOM 197198]
MFNNIEMQDTENTDEWVTWIEEAIVKGYFKSYEYKHFNNIKVIGSGAFGKVYCANWKDSTIDSGDGDIGDVSAGGDYGET